MPGIRIKQSRIGNLPAHLTLQRLQGEVVADIHFQPFELNPQMPAEGESIAEHLQRKYGMSDMQLAENQERIRARGAELGFVFDFNARSRIWNTFDAHRLLHWAGIEGKQLELKQALLRAYFSEGGNVSDHATLAAVAAGVGLDAERAQAIKEDFVAFDVACTAGDAFGHPADGLLAERTDMRQTGQQRGGCVDVHGAFWPTPPVRSSDDAH